jgi:hypothetical protein
MRWRIKRNKFKWKSKSESITSGSRALKFAWDIEEYFLFLKI